MQKKMYSNKLHVCSAFVLYFMLELFTDRVISRPFHTKCAPLFCKKPPRYVDCYLILLPRHLKDFKTTFCDLRILNLKFKIDV